MTKVIVGSPVWSLNGVNTFSANLVRGLAASGHDARILLTGVTYRERKPMPFPPDLKIEQMKIPVLATWRRRWQTLIDYLESHAPCIYLPNYDFRHSCVTGALSSRVGVVGIVHSDDPRHYDHAIRMGESWNAGVAVSCRIADRLGELRAVPRERLTTIDYGVAASVQPPARKPAGPLALIYTGRLDEEQKRTGDLIRIAVELKQRGVDFQLTIVGDGPERLTLERGIARRGLQGCVRIVTSVSNDDVLRLCAESDAFILTSAYEGMPISLLEAMGQGCIAIATAIESGVPELVVDGRNGFIVPVGDISAFAQRIAEVALSTDMRERMRNEAWSTISTGRFRTQSMVARYAAVIDQVAGEVSEGTFTRSGVVAPMRLSLEERVAAPLWSFRPDLRKQLTLPP